MKEVTGQGCCAVVLSNDAFTDQHKFIFKHSYLCLRSPVKATKDEGKLSTHFRSLIPVTVTQGGESHPGCCILVRDPCCTPWATGASPHGIPSLRVSWTWGREQARCSSAGGGGVGEWWESKASAHCTVANAPRRKPECITVLSFGHRLLVLLAFLQENHFQHWRKKKRAAFVLHTPTEAGFVALNTEKSHSLQEQEALEKGNPSYSRGLLWSERDCTSVPVSLHQLWRE